MLRIALDVHTIGKKATGNETYAEGLMLAFAQARPEDIELFFYHTGTDVPKSPAGHMRCLSPAWPWLRIPVVTPVRLARDRIDVAHFQYFAPPLSPCPAVVTVHDLSYEKHPEFFPPATAARMRLVMPCMVRLAARVIAVSESTRDDLLSIYGLDPGRVSVIHNGVSAASRPLEDASYVSRATARFGLTRPFVLCVGNVGVRKNQRRLVRAFARVAEAVDHDLVLVGKHTFGAQEVVDEIHALGLAGRVHMTGFVTEPELVALYNRATLSVYPSLYEGFGLPVVESMACGTPVITSAVSSLPEIAGQAAILVDPTDEAELADAISGLLADPGLRERLRAAGLERSRHFSWDEAARKTLEVYRAAARR